MFTGLFVVIVIMVSCITGSHQTGHCPILEDVITDMITDLEPITLSPKTSIVNLVYVHTNTKDPH